jgi:hypothetical protein
MTKSRVLSTIYVLLSMCVSVFLWHFWTPKCNESCPEWIALSMYGTILGIPILAVGIATITLLGKVSHSHSLSIKIFGVCVVALMLWVGFLTFSTGS